VLSRSKWETHLSKERSAVVGLEKGCKLLYTAILVKDMYGFELIIMRRIFRCRVLGEELAGWWRYVHEERGDGFGG
jgi:hypothetical protein